MQLRAIMRQRRTVMHVCERRQTRVLKELRVVRPLTCLQTYNDSYNNTHMSQSPQTHSYAPPRVLMTEAQ